MREVQNPTDLQHFVEQYQLHRAFRPGTVSQMKLYQLAKAEVLCSPGDPMDQLFLLVAGKLKISKTLANGRHLLLRFNEALSLLGEVEFINQCPAVTHVQAVTECRIIGIGVVWLQDEYKDNSAFLQFLLTNVSRKLYTTSNATSINMLTTVDVRFASYLVSTCTADHASVLSQEIRAARLTDIAELLGTSYRHLNRVIQRFCAEHMIERRAGRLVVKDFARLQQLSNGNVYE